MPHYKLMSLSIALPPFRKLGSIELTFSERITLIAGHNGIGKSTILALIANGSGLTDKEYNTYTGLTFQGNLNEIIYLDYETEFVEKKDLLPRPVLTYDLDGHELSKRCALTKRTREATKKSPERPEVRVVPRNIPIKDFKVPGSKTIIKQSGKVPLPTIFLGMTRMLPVGEIDPDDVDSSIDESIHPEDAAFIRKFIDAIIPLHSIDGPHEITTQVIKGTRKSSKHPSYNHSSKTISLGQDSLSSIATALASFQRLSREWDDYPGGLLVIDEIDAGFHPYAQRKLMEKISTAARQLRLQVVATTHSLPLIETIHPESRPTSARGEAPNKVIYIRDSRNPSIAELSLKEIQDDMNLLPPTAASNKKTGSIKVYLEDAEANVFFKKLLTRRVQRHVKLACGLLLKPIPVSLACTNLQGLQKFDPHFKTVIIAVDADSPVKRTKGAYTKNIVKLPGGILPSGKGMNPERTVHDFAKSIVANPSQHAQTLQKLHALNVTTDHLQEYLLEGDFDISKREPAKRWMRERLDFIMNSQLVELWFEENPAEISQFVESLVAAAIATSKLIK